LEKVDSIPESLPWSDLVRVVADTLHPAYPVVASDGSLRGVLAVREVRAALLDPALSGVAVAGDLADRDPLTVAHDDDLQSALRKLGDRGVAVVSIDGRPVGVLTREAILEAWRRATETV
jgi:CBS domain-containing protein